MNQTKNREQSNPVNADRIPDWAYTMMSFSIRTFRRRKGIREYLQTIGLNDGMVAIDYGCGPGVYIPDASGILGKKGKLIAVDIQDLARDDIERVKRKYNLNNVEVVISNGYKCQLKEDIADIVYAFDMFHMVSHPHLFLDEIKRLLKPDGFFILEDGHQPRALTIEKILASGNWIIEESQKKYLRLKPVN